MSATDPRVIHDPTITSVFEILGSYFTDTIYNHIHSNALTNVSRGSSVTDEFVRRLNAYMVGVKSDQQCYRDVIQGLHRQFATTTRFTAISFAEFVDRVVGICVPKDYFDCLTHDDKDEILSSVICDLISSLAAFSTVPDMLRRIIDEHDKNPAVTVRMLLDASVDALVAKRATLFNKFLRKEGQVGEQIPVTVVSQMKKVIRGLVKDKAEILSRVQQLESVNERLKADNRNLKIREAKMSRLVGLLRSGQKLGIAAAGAALRVPKRSTIAEEILEPPRKERHVARGESSGRESDQSGSDGASGSSDSPEQDEQSLDSPGENREPSSEPAGPERRVVSPDFFKKSFGAAAAPAKDRDAAPAKERKMTISYSENDSDPVS